jgi:hypothetical protein
MSAESVWYLLLFFGVLTAVSAWFFGWLALVPAALFSVWTMIRIIRRAI